MSPGPVHGQGHGGGTGNDQSSVRQLLQYAALEHDRELRTARSEAKAEVEALREQLLALRRDMPMFAEDQRAESAQQSSHLPMSRLESVSTVTSKPSVRTRRHESQEPWLPSEDSVNERVLAAGSGRSLGTRTASARSAAARQQAVARALGRTESPPRPRRSRRRSVRSQGSPPPRLSSTSRKRESLRLLAVSDAAATAAAVGTTAAALQQAQQDAAAAATGPGERSPTSGNVPSTHNSTPGNTIDISDVGGDISDKEKELHPQQRLSQKLQQEEDQEEEEDDADNDVDDDASDDSGQRRNMTSHLTTTALEAIEAFEGPMTLWFRRRDQTTDELGTLMRSYRRTRLQEMTLREKRLHWMVHSHRFGTLCTAMVLINAVLLGLTLNHSSVNLARADQMPPVYDVGNKAFTVWFLAELTLRYAAVGCVAFFRGPDSTWNIFDTFVVLGDIVDTMVGFFSISDSGGRSSITVLRIIRVARITRAVRVVRMVRFLRELRMMIYSVLSCGWSIVWSMLLFFIILYIFGIYFTQVVVYHLSDMGYDGEDRELLREHWGSLTQGWYTLFLCMSGGADWGDVAAPLVNIHWSHALVMIIFVFFTVFVVANIITGVLVDSVVQSAQSDRHQLIQDELHTHQTMVKQMMEVFVEADKDHSGTISIEELEAHLKNKEVLVLLHSIGLHLEEARDLFNLLDLDASGEVSIEEFVRGCTRLKGGAKAVDLARLMQEFYRLDLFVRDCFSRLDVVESRKLHRSLESLAFSRLTASATSRPLVPSSAPQSARSSTTTEIFI